MNSILREWRSHFSSKLERIKTGFKVLGTQKKQDTYILKGIGLSQFQDLFLDVIWRVILSAVPLTSDDFNSGENNPASAIGRLHVL
jgi:hypothetical protein